MLVLTAVVTGSICLGLGLGVFFTKIAARTCEIVPAQTAEAPTSTQPECVLS